MKNINILLEIRDKTDGRILSKLQESPRGNTIIIHYFFCVSVFELSHCLCILFFGGFLVGLMLQQTVT